MLCVELHDPDRIIPVLGLAGGLVDQGRNQSHHNSPVAIEGNPNAVLRLVPIDFPTDNTAVFLRRVQVKDQAAAIVYIIHKSPPMVMDTPFYKEYSCFVLD